MNKLIHITSHLIATLATNSLTRQNQLAPEAIVLLHAHSLSGAPKNFEFRSTSLGLREMAASLVEIADGLDHSVAPLIATPLFETKSSIEPLLQTVTDILEKMDVTDKGEELDRLQSNLDTIDHELGASGWNWREFIPYNEEGDYFPRVIPEDEKPAIVAALAKEAFEISTRIRKLPQMDRAAATQEFTDKLAELSRKGFHCRDAVLDGARELEVEYHEAGKVSGASIEDFIAQAEKGVQFRGGDPAQVQANRDKFEAAAKSGMTVMEAVAAFVSDPEWNPCSGGGCCAGDGGPKAPPVEDETGRDENGSAKA